MKRALQAVLALNAGSSTLKFALYPCAGAGAALHADAAVVSGAFDGLQPGGKPSLRLQSGAGETTQALPALAGDPFDAALAELGQALRRHATDWTFGAVAHRIVHGGERYTDSVVLDDAVLAYLASLSPLAPLHQPHNLAGVAACRRAWPALPQVGAFDTGFHARLPALEQWFALPRALRGDGIRRYGFHGLSYRYVAARLGERSGRAGARVLMAHLGSGASACAMLGGVSIATSMGFSALDGLMMGSRSGSVDPGVLLYLMQQGWDAARLEKLLYRESGLLGVSGVSADVRTLRASAVPEAAFALDLFTHRLVKECGALTACLDGLDVLVFTGGIGEHDHVLRAQVCERLGYLGLRIDPERNRAAGGSAIAALHADGSAVEIWVVPTDEGRVAAADAAALCADTFYTTVAGAAP
jgi:acetate kinase